MSTVKSAIAEGNKFSDKINIRYTMRLNHMFEIKENSAEMHEAIMYAFKFGYAQGTKAERAKNR